MQNMVYYILLGLTALSNSGGGLMLKVGAKNVSFGNGESLSETALSMITNWRLIVGICLYGSSFIFSTLAFTKLNLNIGYPIIVGASFLLISLASVLFLDEKFTPMQIVGYLFLLTGIVLISFNVNSSLSK